MITKLGESYKSEKLIALQLENLKKDEEIMDNFKRLYMKQKESDKGVTVTGNDNMHVSNDFCTIGGASSKTIIDCSVLSGDIHIPPNNIEKVKDFNGGCKTINVDPSTIEVGGVDAKELLQNCKTHQDLCIKELKGHEYLIGKSYTKEEAQKIKHLRSLRTKKSMQKYQDDKDALLYNAAINSAEDSVAKPNIRETKMTKQLSIEDTLKERGSRYGCFKDLAEISGNLRNVMELSPNWKGLSLDKQEALIIIMHKVARILNGDPEYADSWHDIAGYATLVENELNKEP